MKFDQKGFADIVILGVVILLLVAAFTVWKINSGNNESQIASQPKSPEFVLATSPVTAGITIEISTVEEYPCSNFWIDTEAIGDDGLTFKLGESSIVESGNNEEICLTALGPATSTFNINIDDGESKTLKLIHENRENIFIVSRNNLEIKIIPTELNDIGISEEEQTVTLSSDELLWAECYFVANFDEKESNHKNCLDFFDAIAATGEYSMPFDRARLPGTVYIESKETDAEILRIMEEHQDSRFIMEVNKPTISYDCDSGGECQVSEISYYRTPGSDFRYLR